MYCRNLKNNTAEQITSTRAQDMVPVWLGDTIYYLSDRDWTMNLFAYDTRTPDPIPVNAEEVALSVRSRIDLGRSYPLVASLTEPIDHRGGHAGPLPGHRRRRHHRHHSHRISLPVAPPWRRACRCRPHNTGSCRRA